MSDGKTISFFKSDSAFSPKTALGGEFKNNDNQSEFGVDSEKIKGSEVHFMGDFDEVALSWINEEEGKFQSKKSITGFSDVSDIYISKEEK